MKDLKIVLLVVFAAAVASQIHIINSGGDKKPFKCEENCVEYFTVCDKYEKVCLNSTTECAQIRTKCEEVCFEEGEVCAEEKPGCEPIGCAEEQKFCAQPGKAKCLLPGDTVTQQQIDGGDDVNCILSVDTCDKFETVCVKPGPCSPEDCAQFQTKCLLAFTECQEFCAEFEDVCQDEVKVCAKERSICKKKDTICKQVE